MLIEFSVKNYLSFKDRATLSMVATKPIKEFRDDNVIVTERYNLLKCEAIYGANASGKSNLLRAMRFMTHFAFHSAKETQAKEPINVTPYKLATHTKNKPSSFEIVFIIDKVKYRYGFEVDKEMVVAEWLYYATKIQEKELFLRENDIIDVAKAFKEGKGLEAKTRDNALFLSVVAQLNGETAIKILNWFGYGIRELSDNLDKFFQDMTAKMLNDEKSKDMLLKLIQRADFNIDLIRAKEVEIDVSENTQYFNEEFRKELLSHLKDAKDYEIKTIHKVYDEEGKEAGLAEFDFINEESEGTKKYFNVIGPIIRTLAEGRVLVIDELDTRIHPNLTRALVKLFNSKETNPNNAQLIFATHDTNILSSHIFRRDQIWFAEKDEKGATSIYSLSELRIRKDASYEKDYLKGRYGAIPFITTDFFKFMN